METEKKWIVFLGPDELHLVEYRPESKVYEFVRGEREGDPGAPVECPAKLADELLRMKFREWANPAGRELDPILKEVPMEDARNYGAKHFKEVDGPGGAIPVSRSMHSSGGDG